MQGAAEWHYDTMSVEEICGLSIDEIANKDAVLFYGRPSRSCPKPCVSLRRGAFSTKPLLLSGSNRTKAERDGFSVWASGRGEMRKSAYLLQRAIRIDTLTPSISSLSAPCGSTARNPMKQGRKLLLLWATCPVWSCSPAQRRRDGMSGATKYPAILS